MELGKRIEASNRATQELTEEAILRIQSFLGWNEAGRTIILSKPWYAAWLTRPNLELVESNIPSHNYEFLKFANKTMQRYEELNLKIQSFRLRMHNSIDKQLIQKAMKLGATDLVIELPGRSNVYLPLEVFAFETLVNLSLHGCKIELVLDYGMVRFSRLTSLTLYKVCTRGNSLADVIISTCPLIEKLVIFDCDTFEGGKLVFEPQYFHKLEVLSLTLVKIGNWFFSDLPLRFPCLKDLTVDHCNGYNEIQIFSTSLECISITDYNQTTWRANFDVPTINKFKLEASSALSLSFKTTSTDWESEISIHCRRLIDVRECLSELSHSKIYLDLAISCTERDYCNVGDVIGLHRPPRVEKLTILQMNAPSSIHSTILEDLFWICRPNFLVLYWVPCPSFVKNTNNDFVRLLYNTLIGGGNANRKGSALRDLEDVNAEFFVRACRLPCKTLLEALLIYAVGCRIRVCLQLRWGKHSRFEDKSVLGRFGFGQFRSPYYF